MDVGDVCSRLFRCLTRRPNAKFERTPAKRANRPVFLSGGNDAWLHRRELFVSRSVRKISRQSVHNGSELAMIQLNGKRSFPTFTISTSHCYPTLTA